jgi:hypothetical protein
MSFRELNNPVKEIKDLASEKAGEKRSLQIYYVTSIDFEDKNGFITDYKCTVKSMVTKVQFDNVPILGIGLGNYKGIMKYPEVNDMVLCAFLDNSPTPVVLGTLFDYFTQSPDKIPLIKRNEYLMTNKQFGSIIYMTQDNKIIIKCSEPTTGNFKDALTLKRAEITLNPGTLALPGSISFTTDGALSEAVGLALTQAVVGAWTIAVGGLASITVTGAVTIQQAGTGAGIFISPSGAVTIKGTSINFVQV